MTSYPFRPYLAEPKESGCYGVIQQGDNPIVGYADGSPFSNFEDVVIFGDHTVSLYKPENPFFIATDGIRILGIKGIEGAFFFSLLERYVPKPQGYKRHFTMLADTSIYLATNTEHIQIGAFFRTVETLITLHQRTQLNTCVLY